MILIKQNKHYNMNNSFYWIVLFELNIFTFCEIFETISGFLDLYV